jgi:hypothetical protein
MPIAVPAAAGVPGATRPRGLLASALALALALPGGAAPAQSHDADLARAVQATFLYKFAAFVEWPEAAFAAPESPLRICVEGDAVMGELARRGALGQRVGARRLEVAVEPPTEAGCHALYLGAGVARQRRARLEAARGEPVLTFTDEVQGVEPDAERGIVHFVLLDGRVRFEIDQRLAEEAGLRISPSVLELAVRVRR